MKIVLINPHDNNSSTNREFNSFIKKNPELFVHRIPSLPLITVAALTPPDFDVKYVDERMQDVDFDEKADLFAIGAMTQQATRAYEIADALKKRGNKVVMGGIHATVRPEEAKKHVDHVITGEAEDIWAKFLADFKRHRAADFYHGTLADLTKSPIPRFDLLSEFDRPELSPIMVPLQMTRGCPHNCAFCTVTQIYGPRYRTKSVTQIVREIEGVLRNIKTQDKYIRFNDDNPFVNRKFAYELLHAITPLKIKWFTLVDITIANDPKLLDLMKKAGCEIMGVGFESITHEVLKDVSPWKRGKLKLYEKAAKVAVEHGIRLLGGFIFGFDHDTEDSFKRVMDFVLKNHVLCKYSIATPFPGTRFYDELFRQGRIKKDVAWKDFNFYNVVFKTKMPETKLMKLFRWIFEETWSEETRKKIDKHFLAAEG